MTHRIFPYPSGIYQIRNLINGKIYVGQSCRLVDRRYNHFRLLSINKEHNPHLQSSYNKYGKDAFVFEVLIYCDVDVLDHYEQLYIDILCPEYNIRKDASSNRGHRMSEETKKRIGNSNRGQVRSEETKKKLSLLKKGKSIHSNEFKKSQSERMLGGKGFHPLSKLTPSNVIEIRRLRNNGNISFREIGKLFNVNATTVQNICSRRTWKHI